jgi:hypothetical protein
MISRQQLERMLPAQVAALCQRVADNPGAYLADAAEQAVRLKSEWGKLDSQPNPNYAVQQKIERQKDHLQIRMIEFLAENL